MKTVNVLWLIRADELKERMNRHAGTDRIIKQLSLGGQLPIPIELRRALGWEGGTYIKIIPYKDHVVLRAVAREEGLLQDIHRTLHGLEEVELQQVLLTICKIKKDTPRG